MGRRYVFSPKRQHHSRAGRIIPLRFLELRNPYRRPTNGRAFEIVPRYRSIGPLPEIAMKPWSRLFFASSFAFVACSPAPVTTPVPVPAPAPTVSAPPPTASTYVPAVALTEAPKNWQLLDQTAD